MSDSTFQARVTYDAGKSFARRFGGRKYNFKQFKPQMVTDRDFAKLLYATPGFSVAVIAGSLDDDAPAAAAPVKKKLLPKKRKKKSA